MKIARDAIFTIPSIDTMYEIELQFFWLKYSVAQQ